MYLKEKNPDRQENLPLFSQLSVYLKGIKKVIEMEMVNNMYN